MITQRQSGMKVVDENLVNLIEREMPSQFVNL